MEQALIRAEMQDGSVVEEMVVGFWSFVEAVLSFRRDPDVRTVRWWVLGRRREAAAA